MKRTFDYLKLDSITNSISNKNMHLNSKSKKQKISFFNSMDFKTNFDNHDKSDYFSKFNIFDSKNCSYTKTSSKTIYFDNNKLCSKSYQIIVNNGDKFEEYRFNNDTTIYIERRYPNGNIEKYKILA